MFESPSYNRDISHVQYRAMSCIDVCSISVKHTDVYSRPTPAKLTQHLESRTTAEILLTDAEGLVYAGLGVDVDVADALAVAQHRDARGRALDLPDQLGRPTRDDQVYHPVQPTQVLHLLPGAHLYM